MREDKAGEKEYLVIFTREVTEEAEVEVDATSTEEARKIATDLLEAGHLTWNQVDESDPVLMQTCKKDEDE